MNTQQKVRVSFSVLIALILGQTLGHTQSKNFIDQPYLETTAKVDSLVIPDRIYMNILIKESDSKNRESVEKLERSMVDALKDLGVDIDEQLSLSDASTDFRRYFLRGQEVEKTKQYQLIVYEGLSVGKVIQKLEAIDISNIRLTRMEYSQLEDLKLALKSEAIIKAKKQAEALTEPLGQTVGKALLISDKNYFNAMGRNYTSDDQMEVALTSSLKQSEEPVLLNIHKIHVFSEVSVKFKIE